MATTSDLKSFETRSELYKNVADQWVYFYLGDAANDDPVTGQSPTLQFWGDRGSRQTLAGSEISGFSGVYGFKLSAAQTNYDEIYMQPTAISTNLWTPGGVVQYPIISLYTVKGGNKDSKTLEGLRDYYDSSLDTIIQTGIGTTELSGSGWLSEISAAARRWADEPALSPKFDPADMLLEIKSAAREVFTDLMLHGDRQVVVRYDVLLVTDQQDYLLPPNMGEIHALGKYNADTDVVEWSINPSTMHDPNSLGYTIEGNVLRINSKFTWDSDDTITIYYTPNGDIEPHLGSLVWASTADISADGLTVKLPTTATDGSIDQRQSAYGGYIFKILSSTVAGDGIAQAVPIASSSISTTGTPTVTLTLRRPLAPIPDEAQTITYEIIPAYAKEFQDVVALQVARNMLASVGNNKRFQLLTQRYREMARVMRIRASKGNAHTASRFDNRTWHNLDLGYAWAEV